MIARRMATIASLLCASIPLRRWQMNTTPSMGQMFCIAGRWGGLMSLIDESCIVEGPYYLTQVKKVTLRHEKPW